MPMLRIPRLYGNVSFCNGNVTAVITNEPDDFDLIRDMLELKALQVTVATSEFRPGHDSSPKLYIDARSGVKVGGPDGFLASMRGTLNTETETASSEAA